MCAEVTNLKLIQMLIYRLERISADSYWAHRASGVRGALLRIIELDQVGSPTPPNELEHLIKIGFDILEKAAGE